MSQQLTADNQPQTGHSARDEWLITRVGDIALYITVVSGYLFSLLTSESVSTAGFVLFTALNLLYLLATWATWTRWRLVGRADKSVALGVGAVVALCIATSLLMPLGLQFDWLLYYATTSMAIVILPTWSGLAVAIFLYLSIPCVFILTADTTDSSSDWLSLLAGFVFVGAFSYSNRLLVAERERSRKLLRQVETSNRELAEAHSQLQAYANEVEELAVARERARMARDIHDTLGHYLTILSIQLETIAKLQERDPGSAAAEVEEARHVVAQSMQEVRNAVSAMRSTDPATLSLPATLSQLADEFRSVAGDTQLAMDLETNLPPLSTDLQLALYRSAQEALTNIRKHANATKVLLRLRYEHDTLELVVLDNGISTLPNGSANGSGGFGLLGLKERIELLGGEATYGKADPAGYRVTVRVPVRVQSSRFKVQGSADPFPNQEL